jgi:hypothetical protein
MSPSTAGLGSLGFSSVVSLVSTRDVEGPGDSQSEVCVAEKVDGVGNKGSGNTLIVDIETILDAFFGGIWTWDYFPQLLKYRAFQSISRQIKGTLL